MKPLSYFAQTAQQVTLHPVEVLKLEATLNAAATAGLYLQIHDANAAPADGAVPVKCWPASECQYKEFKRGELTLAVGCYICLSTTAATKTLAGGGSDTMDILEVELFYPEYPVSTSFAGDLVSNVTRLQVWADAAGPKKLIALEIDGTGLNANAFIQIFAKDAPANGDLPLMEFPIKDNQKLTAGNALKFGNDGASFKSLLDDGTIHDGLTVVLSSTAGVLTEIVGQTVNIKAEYK